MSELVAERQALQVDGLWLVRDEADVLHYEYELAGRRHRLDCGAGWSVCHEFVDDGLAPPKIVSTTIINPDGVPVIFAPRRPQPASCEGNLPSTAAA